MTFSDQIIPIKSPIYALRYNSPDNTSPHYEYKKWDLSKRSVMASGRGIFGVRFNEITDTKGVFEQGLAREKNILILLESDADHIVQDTSETLYLFYTPIWTRREIAFSEANIIASARGGEFCKMFELAVLNNISKSRDPFTGLQNIRKSKFLEEVRILQEYRNSLNPIL
jgi:hypothetical protein